MSTNRLEAFSDGVLAIIITIMVLEMKVPHGVTFQDLAPVVPIFLSYVLSFINVGIYWNNHHYLLSTAKRVNGTILWANLHLLFWLSLVPFTTGWMGENNFATTPVAVYGFVLLMAGSAYFILQKQILKDRKKDSALARAIGKDIKGRISLFAYVMAIIASFVNVLVSCGLYALVALIWLVPDKRIERALKD